jgi:vacuolar-type H+-ATPase subunit I/STV1
MRGKRLLIIALSILLAVAVACGNNNNNNGEEKYHSKLVIKASVKSGEPLVDKEFYVLTYSLLEKMRLIERDVRQEYDLGGLEEAIRQKINYHPQKDALDKRINNALDYYNSNMKRSEAALDNLKARERNLLASVKPSFQKYINVAYTNPQERNNKLRELNSKSDWDGIYYYFLNETRKVDSFGSQAKAAFDTLQQKIDSNQKTFNQIQKQIVHHTKVLKTLPDETRRKLDRWQSQIDKLKEEVYKRTSEIRVEVQNVTKQRCLEWWQTADKTPFKTDKKGKATVKVMTGKYWIAGIIKINDKNLIWDLPHEILRSKSEAEINMQNVIDIKNPELKEIVIAALSGQLPEKVAEKTEEKISEEK